MEVSDRALNQCKNLEGHRQYPYDDKTGKRLFFGQKATGKATIGYGYVMSEDEQKDRRFYEAGWTSLQAGTMLTAKAKVYADCVRNSIKVPVNQNQFDAMFLLCYNIGVNAFAKSSVCRLVNQGKFKEAAEAFKLWHKGNGVPHRLDKRREAEIDLFNRRVM